MEKLPQQNQVDSNSKKRKLSYIQAQEIQFKLSSKLDFY